ncbi:MAG: Mo-dependent nitrogenase C-terminal domain-containing protein [Phormidesmis sp.]
MTPATKETSYTSAQIQIWLRGLLTVAWADGHFDEGEKEIIYSMVDSEFSPDMDVEMLEPIEPAALAALGLSSAAAQNFLRMAVMVALADGTYSDVENDRIMAFAEAIAPESVATLSSTLKKLTTDQSQSTDPQTADSETTEPSTPLSTSSTASPTTPPEQSSKAKLDPLKPARKWLDQLSIEDPRLARFVCKLVPSDCPFERDVKLFGKKVVHIPPMCKINPLYEQLVGLRFRALSYLADDVGEDVTAYL